MTATAGGSSFLFWIVALAMVALAWSLLCLPMWRRSGRGDSRHPDDPSRVPGAAGGARGAARAAVSMRYGDLETPDGVDAAGVAAERARITANAAVLAEQLNALDADLAAGRIDAGRHLVAQTELHRRLLDEAGGVTQLHSVPSDDPGGASAAVAGGAAAAAGVPTSSSRRDGRRLSILLAVALPAIAIASYLGLGDPKALSSSTATSTAASREPSPEEIAAMVDSLAENLRRRPDGGRGDLQGWVLLGRSYAGLQRFDDAAKAYAVALEISPDNPQLLADRADMLAMHQGQRLEGEPRRLIERALALDPRQLKALAMAGSAAFERREWAAASGYWQRARKLVDDGSDLAQGLDRSLAEVAAAAGGDGAGAVVAASPAPAASTAATASPTPPVAPPVTAAVTGTVRLAPALAARIAPGDTVFVFARAAKGPRMPLAILRRTAADLPLEFRLDDSMAMSPALKLSNFNDVVIGARVSKSGNAMPQPGDLVGEAAAAPGSAAAVQITIDRVQP